MTFMCSAEDLHSISDGKLLKKWSLTLVSFKRLWVMQVEQEVTWLSAQVWPALLLCHQRRYLRLRRQFRGCRVQPTAFTSSVSWLSRLDGAERLRRAPCPSDAIKLSLLTP